MAAGPAQAPGPRRGDIDGDGRTDLPATYDYGSSNANLFCRHANTSGGFDAKA